MAATLILAVLVTPRSNPGGDVAHTNGKPNWILARLSTKVISTNPLVSFQGVVPANAHLPTYDSTKGMELFEKITVA